MNTSTHTPPSLPPPVLVASVGDPSRQSVFAAGRKPRAGFILGTLLAGLLLLLSAPGLRAQGVPPGCTGSAIGISLFTSAPDVHIGDTLFYSVSVFNGLPNNPISCDASNVVASVTTPDGVVHPITLVRTYLTHAQSDFYNNVVSYVVRAQDIRPDGTVRATAEVTAIIRQNDTPSLGGANQGVNTEVSQPCIGITVQCVPGVGESGLITFSGFVTNCGNNTLVGVTVTNQNDNGFFVVLFPTNLARGQSAPFSGSFLPLTPCTADTVTLVATGRDQFTSSPRTVTATASATCQNSRSPSILVTKVCPPQPARPGQPLIFSGSVSNTGNVTLTNIVVVNNQPVANTVVFTRATLVPGEVANFTGSYLAPTNCSVSDTLSATAVSRCGVGVSSTASATCAILTTPQIAVTVLCPANPTGAGGTLTYSGTVRNVGDITLNNIVVVRDFPVPNTTVFTVASLLPGASANFTSSLTVPAGACSVTTSFSGRGQDLCTTTMVTNTVAATCAILTAPAITVTLACPVTPVATGGLITYTGTVRNSGNVTLNNVNVVNNQSVPSTVFTVASLAPGASANFTTSFTTPSDACSVSATVTGSGSDNCTGAGVNHSASATCTLVTTPRLVVTQICPQGPSSLGGVLTYSGSVSNAGNITLTNVVVTNDRTGATAVFTVATLAPGQSVNFTGSYSVPASADCTTTSTLTGSGFDKCTGVRIQTTATATCPLVTAPGITVTQTCPPNPVSPGGTLTYTGTVRNTGNITLTNVVVVNSEPSPNTVILTVASLAPGASANFTGSYQVPLNCCVSSSTATATGRDICTGATVADTFTSTCTVLTVPRIVVTKTCPPTALRPGELLEYSGTVSNAGNITLVDVTIVNTQPGIGSPVLGPMSLAPGESVIYNGSYVVPLDFCGTDTITARGLDVCNLAPVVHSVTTTCPIITTPRILVTKSCPAEATPHLGLLIFTGTVSNPGNVTLTNVFVVNNQPSNNTPVIGPITLIPGQTVSFSGSYRTPEYCCQIVDTLTARGQGRCSGTQVSATATAICPLLNTPSIAVTMDCPTPPVPVGGLVMFTGSVSNSGDTILTNVYVVGSQPNPNTPLLGPIELAPRERKTFSGSYIVPFNTCAVSVTARGQNTCGGVVITNTASCPIATTPRIVITQNCPVNPVSPGGLFTYSGTVSNAGNITLANVLVLNNQSGATPIFTTATLLPGAVASFTGSYLAPANCSTTSTSTATGRSICGDGVTNTATTLCPIITTPLLAITQNCPVTPVSPGGLLTYSGTVSNAGNITLNNLVVTNNQSGNTPLLSVATLAPGAATNFTGSYLAPAIGPTTSTSTARATSLCGVPVTNTASSTCAILATPGIRVTKLCPPAPVAPGGLMVFTGTVTNTGNVTLTSVFVVNNQPAPGTPVLGPIALAPGASTNFTGSYVVPLNACDLTDTLTATGSSPGTNVTSTASATCPVTTTPGIAITETCPPGPVTVGSVVTFGGSVSNTGNVTLTNVFAFSSQPSNNTPVLGPITLTPGGSAPFTGSYIATGGSNPTTNATIATNSSSTITTNVSSVIITNSSGTVTTNVASVIVTNSSGTITTNVVTPTFGTINPVTGILADRFNVPSGLHGLMFADQNQNWGPTLFYSTRHPASGADFLATISTIPPAVGVVTDRFALSSTGYDALTLAAPDVGYGAVNFYYVRHDTVGATTFGVIKAAGASSSSDLWPIPNTGYTGLAFAAADVGGYGANMFYYVRQGVAGLSTFGTINPTPGGIATDRYTVGTNLDALVFVPSAVSTWGTAIFAYLRHDTTGSIIGSINPVTHVATDRLNLGTNFLTALTFTATDVGYGPNLFYYLRPGGSSLTTNTVTTLTTNTVITFTTNTVTTYTTNAVFTYTTNIVFTFTTNNVVRFTPTNTVTAVGTDICRSRTVTASADCLGPVTPGSLPPINGTPTMVNGDFHLSFPTENGKSYTVQYKNTLNDPIWMDLQTVTGTGGILTIIDTNAAQRPTRFYRVKSP